MLTVKNIVSMGNLRCVDRIEKVAHATKMTEWSSDENSEWLWNWIISNSFLEVLLTSDYIQTKF